jgi:hypothetical protein
MTHADTNQTDSPRTDSPRTDSGSPDSLSTDSDLAVRVAPYRPSLVRRLARLAVDGTRRAWSDAVYLQDRQLDVRSPADRHGALRWIRRGTEPVLTGSYLPKDRTEEPFAA